jgi:hypothetical protein
MDAQHSASIQKLKQNRLHRPMPSTVTSVFLSFFLMWMIGDDHPTRDLALVTKRCEESLETVEN